MFPLGQVPNRVNRENVPVMRLESSITAGHFPYKDTCQKYSINHGYTCKRAGLHWTREFIFPYKCKIAGLQHISGSSYFTAWLQCSWRLYASEIRYHTQGLQYLVWNTYVYYFVQPLTRETNEHTHINTHTQSHPLNQLLFSSLPHQYVQQLQRSLPFAQSNLENSHQFLSASEEKQLRLPGHSWLCLQVCSE